MILRVCICIPTYNNPLTIATVIDEALILTKFPVLVVDDGSEKPVEQLLSNEARTALADGRLSILRHDVNQGKGVALQNAIKATVARGFTHLMAVDGDGQHHVSEVEKMIAIAKTDPWDLVIGHRKFKSSTVPGISKFGRKFSNFWVQFQTGTPIADSQSGFRLYPLFFCQNLKFWTSRYDFEIEILIRLMWRGVRVQETEIEVFYPEPDQRVSHFNKFWDNVRISCLNTVFVVVSLLKTHKSPRELAIATGSGVFIGCTPFFGLHTAIVAAVSFLFRLNAGVLWLGSQVSIPPLAPFLIIGSVTIGKFVSQTFNPDRESIDFDITQHSFREFIQFGSTHLLDWLIGSLILGAVLGLTTTALTYLIARRIQKPASEGKNWSGKTRGGKLGNGFLRLVLKHLDLRIGYFILLFIVPYFYLFAPRGRKSLNEFYLTIQPEKSWLTRQALIVKHFYRFGQVLMDRLAQSFASRALFEPNSKGFENILGTLERGESVILLGAHVGGWDLAVSLLKNRAGFKSSIHVVEYQASGQTLKALKPKDNDEKIQFIPSNQAPQPIFNIHELLDQGKPIGLMGDRPMSNRYELVPFCGKLAAFDVSAFRIAAAGRVPLIQTFGFKAPNRIYDFYATKPIQYVYDPELDRGLQCLDWCHEFAERLGLMIRQYPDQWFNFFPFWSSLPTPPSDVKAGRAPNYLEEELRKPKHWKFAKAPNQAPSVDR